MSIQVENKLQKTNKEAFEQRAHYVPCKIEEDGPADVEKYFEPYVIEENSELTASFRGHPLDGTKLSFPDGYRAVIVTETKRPLSEDADRKFHYLYLPDVLYQVQTMNSASDRDKKVPGKWGNEKFVLEYMETNFRFDLGWIVMKSKPMANVWFCRRYEIASHRLSVISEPK